MAFDENLRRIAYEYVDFAVASPETLSLYYRSAFAGHDVPEAMTAENMRALGLSAFRGFVSRSVSDGAIRLRADYEAEDLVAHLEAALEMVFTRALFGVADVGPVEIEDARRRIDRMFDVVLRGIRDEGARR